MLLLMQPNIPAKYYQNTSKHMAYTCNTHKNFIRGNQLHKKEGKSYHYYMGYAFSTWTTYYYQNISKDRSYEAQNVYFKFYDWGAHRLITQNSKEVWVPILAWNMPRELDP